MDEFVIVESIPLCDLFHEDIVLAVYDAKSVYGPWLYMCEDDFRRYGVGLGTGRGQRLVLKQA